MRAGSKILPQVARLIAHGAYANSRSFNDAIFCSGPDFDLDCEAALFLLVWSITARVSADPNSCSPYEPITNYFCPLRFMLLCPHANRLAIGEFASRNLPQRSLAGACSRHRAGKQRHFQLELPGRATEFAGKFRFFRSPVPRHSSEVAGSYRQSLQGMGGNTWTSMKNSCRPTALGKRC